jgi:hypothetical protein
MLSIYLSGREATMDERYRPIYGALYSLRTEPFGFEAAEWRARWRRARVPSGSRSR